MKVIVIEDNADEAQLVRMALIKCGVKPVFHVLASAAEALHFFSQDLVAQRIADLVVVDLNLGDGHGEALLPLIRRRLSDQAQVIVLTASFQRAGMDECYRQGADACFIKPRSFDELAAIFLHLVRGAQVAPAAVSDTSPSSS